MVYFDNSATTLHKPPAVAAAVADAMATLGNAGRSFYPAAMNAARQIYATRQAVAQLADLQNPLHVAFTSGATESLNLLVAALVRPGDGVITTVLEHNSVLRPLYRSGCELQFLGCDDNGTLLLESLPTLLTPRTRFVFATHGSNLLGSVTDTARLGAFCRENGLTLVLDAAQTMGQTEVTADMADVLCFTGHKALLGPQGTGGILAQNPLPFAVTKTGGSGFDAFALNQGTAMPGVFEAGTANAHGLAGLAAGIEFVTQTGLPAIQRHAADLTERFLVGLRSIPDITVYGDTRHRQLPVVALNVGDLPSEEAALRLWEQHGIATRPGSHCAPLAHRRFATEERGMVRFSFGWHNTAAEIDTALAALRQIATIVA